MAEVNTPTYTKKDFESDQAVRWCPGCGDYAILAQTQKTMPTFGRREKRTLFCFWNWLFKQVSLLHESLWFPFHTW